jgi:hypothetical protein
MNYSEVKHHENPTAAYALVGFFGWIVCKSIITTIMIHPLFEAIFYGAVSSTTAYFVKFALDRFIDRFRTKSEENGK